jgi:hypothetical protein
VRSASPRCRRFTDILPTLAAISVRRCREEDRRVIGLEPRREKRMGRSAPAALFGPRQGLLFVLPFTMRISRSFTTGGKTKLLGISNRRQSKEVFMLVYFAPTNFGQTNRAGYCSNLTQRLFAIRISS